MSFGAPTPPDPTATSNTQQQYNNQAAQTQNKTNSYNQAGPLGSVNYVADPNSPSGYSVQTAPGALGGSLLGSAGNLAQSSAGMYSQPFNGANKAVTDQLNNWSAQYLQPIFNQQQSNTDAQLRNQGLNPGSEAYNNAENLLARNQGDVTNQYLQQNEGQAFNQALQQYQSPLQTIAGLETAGAPQGFQQTPTAQDQPANYAGAVQANYQGQLQNYQNTWNNIGKLGTAAVGLAAAPFTGGTSLAAAVPGMFNSATNGMFQSNPYNSMPQIGGGWGNG